MQRLWPTSLPSMPPPSTLYHARHTLKKKKKTLPQTVLRYSIRDQTEYDPAGGRRCFLMLHMNGNPWWEWSALEDNRRLYSSCELKKKKKKKNRRRCNESRSDCHCSLWNEMDQSVNYTPLNFPSLLSSGMFRSYLHIKFTACHLKRRQDRVAQQKAALQQRHNILSFCRRSTLEELVCLRAESRHLTSDDSCKADPNSSDSLPTSADKFIWV